MSLYVVGFEEPCYLSRVLCTLLILGVFWASWLCNEVVLYASQPDVG